ncbi:MAG: 4Fe-4S dicluster domain-containing protein [Desulfobacteraceae bacterium]|nr:MAG: 4Fe-4S dicluster domain-containing protein [Desulfobacteraceae bacterium]
MRWGMAINLTRCVGCYACVIACKTEHFLPRDVSWNRVAVFEAEGINKQIYPTLCNHCKEPPCVEVCPTGATEQRKDGIVWVDSEKCIGCRSCMMACPYQVRVFNEKPGEYFPGQGFTPYEEMRERIYPLQQGTVSKCNFCMERIEAGLSNGKRPGADREVTPACVNACPAKARIFGDLDDAESEVSMVIRIGRGYQLRPEAGTDPSIYYIAK